MPIHDNSTGHSPPPWKQAAKDLTQRIWAISLPWRQAAAPLLRRTLAGYSSFWSKLLTFWASLPGQSRLALGGGAAVVLLGWWGCSGGGGLPMIDTVEGEEPPSAAQDAVESLFEKRFAADGKSHYTVMAVCRDDQAGAMQEIMRTMQEKGKISLDFGSDLPPMLMRLWLIELRDLHTAVKADQLTEADKLNDVRWKGTFEVHAKVERRRLLNLAPGIAAIAQDRSQDAVGWTDQPIRWVAATLLGAGDPGEGEVETAGKKLDADLPFNLFSIYEEAEDELLKVAVSQYLGGDWGDWSDVESVVYQRTHVVLRGDEVTTTNDWEPEDVLPDGEHVAGIRVFGGEGLGAMYKMFGGNLQILSDDSNDAIFFLLPDMDALDDADLF